MYYTPRVDEEDLKALKALDALYTAHPFYGSRRLRLGLQDAYGMFLGRDHVRRLMKVMGIEAIYPKKHTSEPAPGHRIYPYLLTHLPITHSNKVWGADISPTFD
jgi:putative transposase